MKIKVIFSIVVVLSLIGVTLALINADDSKPAHVIHKDNKLEDIKEEPTVNTETVKESKEIVITEETKEVSKQAEPTLTTKSPAKNASENPYPLESSIGYVYNQREKAGKVVGAWGGASSWPAMARSQGLSVDSTPQLYDACVIGTAVYFVESVSDIDFTASTYMGGVLTQTFSKESSITSGFRCIH